MSLAATKCAAASASSSSPAMVAAGSRASVRPAGLAAAPRRPVRSARNLPHPRTPTAGGGILPTSSASSTRTFPNHRHRDVAAANAAAAGAGSIEPGARASDARWGSVVNSLATVMEPSMVESLLDEVCVFPAFPKKNRNPTLVPYA